MEQRPRPDIDNVRELMREHDERETSEPPPDDDERSEQDDEDE